MSFIFHCMYIYIYMYICVCVCVCVYIYISTSSYKIETHSQNIENRLVVAKVGEKRENLGLGVWGY